MVYKKEFLYNIYCVTHVTDGVTDDIFWRQGTRIPWFKTRLVPEKKNKRKSIHLIYVIYILYVIYIVYIVYSYYIS